jgi:pimeloyl-ACP methyl ester carboxylesterase
MTQSEGGTTTLDGITLFFRTLIEDGGHAPWIEAPELVFDAMSAFLDAR